MDPLAGLASRLDLDADEVRALSGFQSRVQQCVVRDPGLLCALLNSNNCPAMEALVVFN